MSVTKSGLIFDESNSVVNQILPHKNKWAWDLFMKGCANNWMPTEIQMSKDISQWNDPKVLSDDEKMLKSIREIATNIKPDQIMGRLKMDKNFINTYNKDVYTADKTKQVLKQQSSKIIADLIQGTDAFERYVKLNPNEANFIDSEGNFDKTTKFGKLADAWAESAAFTSVEPVIRAYDDPGFLSWIVGQREAAKQENKATWADPYVKGMKTSLDNLKPIEGELKNEKNLREYGKLKWDPEGYKPIMLDIASVPGVRDVVKIRPEDAISEGLPHSGFLVVKTKDKMFYIDMNQEKEDIRKDIISKININVDANQMQATTESKLRKQD